MFGKDKNKKQTVAILDIASGSIGGLLFERMPQRRAPRVLTSVRQPANFSKRLKTKNLQRNMRNTVNQVSEYLKREVEAEGRDLDLLIYVFSSPWYAAQTRIIKVSRDKPFLIDRKFIKSLIEDEQKTVLQRWNAPGAEKEELIFVESSRLKALLNGYEVTNIWDKSVKTLDYYLYLSVVQKELIQEVEETCLNFLTPQKTKTHTFPFILFNVLKNIINTEEGAIFLDFSGRTTDLFLIRNDIIEEIAYFPHGEYFFIRQISKLMDISKEEAAVKLKQYERGELSDDIKAKIKEVLSESIEKWSNYFKKLLKEIVADDKYLPQTLYFCGSSGILWDVVNQIATSENFPEFTAFGQPLKIRLFSSKALKNHVEFAKGFSNNKDIFLLFSALFANYYL